MTNGHEGNVVRQNVLLDSKAKIFIMAVLYPISFSKPILYALLIA